MYAFGIMALTPQSTEFPSPAVRVQPLAATPSVTQMDGRGAYIRPGSSGQTFTTPQEDSPPSAQPLFGESLTASATAFLAQSLGQESPIAVASTKRGVELYATITKLITGQTNTGEGALRGGTYILV